ncbi:MAG: TonB-dependent receptor, partial [Rhodothermales bacterium]|nr:TonB-dependent receptor [Rhodothermales bacterium]
SAAWRISQEAFMEGNQMVNDLRLRAGYGVVGNQSIPNYLSLALLRADPGARAVLGGQVFTGYAPFQLPNPGLKWEEKQEFTVGLDYGLFDGRVFGAIEFYRNETENLLLEVPLPQPAPVASRVENVGSLRNTGLDFSLDGYVIDQPETTLQLGITFNTNSNEILDLGGREQIFTGSISGRGQSGQNALLLTPGEPFPVFFGAEFVEVNADGDQVFNDYEDTDGDGFGDNLVGTTTSPDSGDRQIIGDPRPDFTYGVRSKLNWKNFGLSVFFRGEQGRELFNNTALVFQTKSAAVQGRGFLADALDDPDALREQPAYSSRWIEDASFLKLDNVTLEYSLEPSMLGTAGEYVRTARVYFSVDNVFTITPYSGYDPEVNTNAQVGLIPAVGIDYTNYPVPRTFTVGVHLGF